MHPWEEFFRYSGHSFVKPWTEFLQKTHGFTCAVEQSGVHRSTIHAHAESRQHLKWSRDSSCNKHEVFRGWAELTVGVKVRLKVRLVTLFSTTNDESSEALADVGDHGRVRFDADELEQIGPKKLEENGDTD